MPLCFVVDVDVDFDSNPASVGSASASLAFMKSYVSFHSCMQNLATAVL